MVTVEELGLEIAELAARVDVATHRMLSCIRQFNEANGWYAQGAVSCAHWLSWRIGLDLTTARERVRVARALGKLPAIDGALAAGRLSYAKVRALSRVATPENEAKLLELALYATGAQLERICRGYRGALAADEVPSPEARSVRRRVLPGGMVRLEIVLCPDEAELVMRALERAREVEHEVTPPDASAEAPDCDCERNRVGSLPAEPAADHRGRVWEPSQGSHHNRVGSLRALGTCQPATLPPRASPSPSPGSHEDDTSAETSSPWPTRADGVVALAESYLAGCKASSNGGDRYQVMIHVDQDPIAADGVVAATLPDGTGVSAETLRRVACDCGLVAVAGDDERLSIGRRTRSIPPAIRRALLVRDQGCRFPGCTHDLFLHGHHIEHWLHGGETSLDNLLLLCPHHHRLVHEGGWSLVLDDGEWRFVAPDGRALPARPSNEVTGDTLLWLQEWAAERNLDLGPDANLPLWDGTRPDYDAAVAGLLAGA